MAKTCPRCTLVSPDSAHLCDCGYSFIGESAKSRGEELAASRRRSRKRLWLGLLAGGLGIAIAVGAHTIGRTSGPRVWGLGVAGILVVANSLKRLRDLRDVPGDRRP